MAEPATFDPSRYLTRVGGSDYLEVKWRLLWLRQTYPDAVIVTDLYSHEDNFAIFRACVTLPGGASATGWGTEGLDDFRDYIEKSETKAIGRALAALGFGTQSCADYEFGGGENRTVDSPVEFASTRGRRAAASGGDKGRVSTINQPMTPSQFKFLSALGREIGWNEDQVSDEASRLYGKVLGELGRRDASSYIEHLQSVRAHVEEGGVVSTPEPPASAPSPKQATGPPKPPTPMQRLHGHATGRKLTSDDVHALAVHWHGVSSRTELNAQQINGMIAAFDPSSGQALDDETLATEIVKAYEAVDARKASAPAPGSPDDLAAIKAILATPSTASNPGDQLDWTENQLRWKTAIDQAISDRQFVAIEASIPKDKHGTPDRMLTDYLAVKREQFANRAQ